MMPCISSDGLSLFFQSNRPSGQGGSRIWVATRAGPNDPWQAPVNLGSVANGSGVRGDVGLSSDGLTLYMAADRSGGSGGLDLWQIPVLPGAGSVFAQPVNPAP